MIQTTAVSKMPQELLTRYEAPEAKNLPSQARDPAGKGVGVHTNYNTPSCNTNPPLIAVVMAMRSVSGARAIATGTLAGA